MISLTKLAQDIAQQALSGPASKPGQRVSNTLSPHFERFVEEAVRRYIIQRTAHIKLEISAILEAEESLEVTSAKINEILQNLTK